MKTIGFELKQAARRVFTWKQTGAVLILTIGLALAAIMFAVGWGYSSFSLPYKDAGQLVKVYYENPGNNLDLQGLYQPFLEWKERKDVFADVAACRSVFHPKTVKTGGGSVTLNLSEVTANFYDTLGVSSPAFRRGRKP